MSGFEGVKINGSQHNDFFTDENGEIRTKRTFPVEFKEEFLMERIFISELLLNRFQQSEKNKIRNLKGQNVKLKAAGRHDPGVFTGACQSLRQWRQLQSWII